MYYHILPYELMENLGFSMGENYFLSLILDAKAMEISSLDGSFLIQHPITINITAVSASQAVSESKQEFCNLSLTVMPEKVQFHSSTRVLHKNQLHRRTIFIDKECGNLSRSSTLHIYSLHCIWTDHNEEFFKKISGENVGNQWVYSPLGKSTSPTVKASLALPSPVHIGRPIISPVGIC